MVWFKKLKNILTSKPKTQVFPPKTPGQKSLTDDAMKMQFEKLKEKLLKEQQKGNAAANAVLSTINGQPPPPQTNQAQTIKPEDYDAVKEMWKDYYHNLEVPQGFESRETWAKNEIEKLNNITNLLTSADQEKIKEGTKQASEALPFLMAGKETPEQK